jgi:hypothetical protein
MEFTYNDELLLNQSDQDTAYKNYPAIFFVLDHQTLRDEFTSWNTRANDMKSKSRRCGVAAVLLATVALLVAAFEQVIHDALPHGGAWDMVPKYIAGATAGAGVIAVAIGYFGVLFRASKEQWLHYRLITERLRQWHAQSLVGQIPAILAATRSDKERTAFLHRRAAEFEEFKRQYITQIAATFPRYGTTSGHGSHDLPHHLIWLRSKWDETDGKHNLDPNDPNLQQLLAAYESIRMCGQLQYTTYKLRSETESFWTHAGVQARVLGSLAFICVIGLLVLHLLVGIGAIGETAWMKGPFVNALIVGSAILALAGRTLEEGLQPQREIDRLETYLARLETAEQQFKKTKSIDEKIKAMRDIEEASVAEMISFLKAGQESRFVM